MPTATVSLSELTREVRNLIAQGDRAKDDAAEFYKQAGNKLKELKAGPYQRNRNGLTWAQFVKRHCGIGPSRAHELIQLADGEITVEQMRERPRQRMQRTRERRRNENVRNVAENGNGRHVAATAAQPSPGCDADPFDADDVTEPGDDPATVNARILINRLAEITQHASLALGNARQGGVAAAIGDAELRTELMDQLVDAIQAANELFNYLQRRTENATQNVQEAVH